MPLSAVLDDTADLGAPEAQEAWREWLRLANATALLPVHQAVLSAASITSHGTAQPAATPVDLTPGWVRIADEFRGEEPVQVLIGELSAAGIDAPDGEVGQELGDGVPFDLVWSTARIAVQFNPLANMTPPPGWRVVAPKADLIVTAWKEHQDG